VEVEDVPGAPSACAVAWGLSCCGLRSRYRDARKGTIVLWRVLVLTLLTKQCVKGTWLMLDHVNLLAASEDVEVNNHGNSQMHGIAHEWIIVILIMIIVFISRYIYIYIYIL